PSLSVRAWAASRCAAGAAAVMETYARMSTDKASGRGCPRVMFVAPNAAVGGSSQVLLNLVVERDAGGYEPVVVFVRDGPAVQEMRGIFPIADVMGVPLRASGRSYLRA